MCPFAFTIRGHYLTRDSILFVVGLLGVAHETLISKGERPTLIVLFAAMMGLPLYLRRDGNGKNGGGKVNGKDDVQGHHWKERGELGEGEQGEAGAPGEPGGAGGRGGQGGAGGAGGAGGPGGISQRRALIGYLGIVIAMLIAIGLYQRHTDARQDRTNERLAVAIMELQEQQKVTARNKLRIAENAKTAQALCDAAAGARDFWKKVRNSTILLLTDDTLSPTERQSNVDFLHALNEVITAADGIARRCDG